MQKCDIYIWSWLLLTICVISVLNDSSVNKRPMHEKTGKWIGELSNDQMRFYKKEYSRVTDQSIVFNSSFRKAYADLFYFIINMHFFFFFFFVGEHFYSCVLFLSVIYPCIIITKVYSRLNRSVIFKSFIALIKCLMNKVNDSRKWRKIRV